MENRIDNFRNAPVKPHAQREAYRSQEEANRVCVSANHYKPKACLNSKTQTSIK
jgi:hypothetical protein